MIIGKLPELSEQLGRGVDRRSIRPGHKAKTLSILVLTQNLLDLSKCLLGLFLRAIGYDLTHIHDRACEHSSHARILDRPNRLERAVEARIQKIVLTNRRHSTAERLDTSEQASRIKMLGPKDAGAAIDSAQPRHQFEIFPNGAKQHLIKMRMSIHETWHEHPAGRVDHLFVRQNLWRRACMDRSYGTVLYAHVAKKRLAVFGHRQNKRIGDKCAAHYEPSAVKRFALLYEFSPP